MSFDIDGNLIVGVAAFPSGGVNAPQVNMVPGWSGALSLFRAFSGITNTGSGIQVQSGPGVIFGLRFTNLGFSGIYFKLYDSTSAPTVGTNVPMMTISAGQNEKSPIQLGNAGVGIQYNNGLWVSATGQFNDNDKTNCSGLSGLLYCHVTFRSGF